MKSLTCLISMRDDVGSSNTWFSNGYSQNVKFFYDLLELLGHYPLFLFGAEFPAKRFTLLGKEYRGLSYQQVLDEGLYVDIIFETGVTVPEDMRALFRNRFGSRIVSVRYGISLIMDMEQLVHNESMSSGIHVAGSDWVWTSPHIGYGKHYLQTLFRCPAVEAPYLWEPDFVSKGFEDAPPEEVRDIYVMEPNLSVIKNALVPMAIVEEVFRTDPGLFGKAMVLNGLSFYQRTYFLENIVRYMDSLRSETNKVFFTGRYRFDDVFKKPDVLLGHQWGCSLNYLYLEALYSGLPLVHNAEPLQEVGYYYPEFDIQTGRDQCIAALKGHKVSAHLGPNRGFIERFSVHNPALQAEYGRLLEQVMDTPPKVGGA